VFYSVNSFDIKIDRILIINERISESLTLRSWNWKIWWSSLCTR